MLGKALLISLGCLALLPAAAASASIAVGDFNGDGRADVAIGTQYESLGSITLPGVVNVLYGTSDGLTPAGAHQFTQADAGGAIEQEDAFGAALAAGDFNGDGRDDLAIGAPQEDVGSGGTRADAGIVNVLYSQGASGLGRPGARQFSQSDAGGAAEAGDHFGSSLAAADLNGDGADDLVVGAPYEDVPGSADAGAINVVDGKPGVGLDITHATQLTQRALGATTVADATFGWQVTSGDFDADHHVDLAVSAPGAEWVQAVYGTATGLSGARTHRFTMYTAGGWPPGQTRSTRFGRQLAAGDFDGDGRDDLAIGTPWQEGGGVVNVVFGAAPGGLSSSGAQVIDQGLTGGASGDDRFGAALATGDFDGDGRDDLAVGSPTRTVGGLPRAGFLHVWPGWAGGLRHEPVDGIRPETYTQSDAGGTVEAEDQFASALAAGDIDHDGHDDVVAAAPGEQLGSAFYAGVVNVLMGTGTTPLLAGRGAYRQLTQSEAAGSTEQGDQFGG